MRIAVVLPAEEQNSGAGLFQSAMLRGLDRVPGEHGSHARH